METLTFGSVSTLVRPLSLIKMLCKNGEKLRPNLLIDAYSPNSTDFMNDPLIFEIPLNLKPTFINMD